LKRNISSIYVPTYYPHPANDKYIRRVVFRARRPRLKSEETKKYVIEKLKIGWAPEIISSRLKAEDKLSCVSHEAIYQYIYKDAEELIQYLPRKHKKRKKKYKYRTNKLEETSKISILDRPEHIGNRTEFGHWESDSIESKNRKNSLNVLVERVSRYVHITKLDSKKACDTANAIINKLSKHPEHFCQSITYDNGSENAQHQKINIKLKTLSYFCQPYRSWEKGAVEQANGLIRRFFPKKTDFSEVSWGEIKKVENLLNSRPKKCLDFKNHKRSIIRYVVHLQLERGIDNLYFTLLV